MKNRLILNSIIIFVTLFALTSCEDVIKVDVKQKEVKLVVDAFVTNQIKNQYIYLKRSVNYFDNPNSQPAVTGAQVAIIANDTSSIHLFADSGGGKYVYIPKISSGDTFKVGKTYFLIIISGGDTLISQSILRPTAKIDSLHKVKETGNSPGIKEGNYVELYAKDLPGFGNNYWVKTFRNDTFKSSINDLNLAYDMAFSPNSNQDAGLFIFPIRYGSINDFGKPWKAGEVATIEVHSINLETFYYLSLVRNENQNGGLFATPPASIPCNIRNINLKKKTPLAGWFNMAAVNSAELHF